MRKYSLSAFALVLAVGFSAFTSIGTSKKTNNAFWYKVDPNTKEVLQEYGFVSQESAQSSSGCNGTGILCGKGYSSDLYNVGDITNQATSLVIKKP